MCDKVFLITGTAIESYAQGSLKLPTRKFYNSVYFHDNQYCHEVANHYRDFKLRRRIRPRKTKVNSKYSHKTLAAKEPPQYEYRQELPVAVHKFPSFKKVYSTRGHQTLCEQRGADLTYNDTIKRIQNSGKNSKVLTDLAKKHLARFKLLKCSRDLNTCEGQKLNKFNNIDKNKQKKQRRRSLGKLESVDYLNKQPQQQQLQFPYESGGGVIRDLCTSKPQSGEVLSNINIRPDISGRCVGGGGGAEALAYYLQLATDYYEQGFLKNIKYLENVGERNQLRRKRQLHLQQQQQQQTNITNDLVNSLETECITDASLNGGDIKRQINQGHSNDINCKYNPIVLHSHQQIVDVNEEFPLNGLSTNCRIRVNIRPQTLNTSQQEIFYGKSENITGNKDLNSMNDYLNGNLVLQQQQQQQQQNQNYQQPTSDHHKHNNYSNKVLLIDSLIDNLKELDIQDNRTNLPRITFTDYSHKYPIELNSDYQTESCAEGKKHLDNHLLKQTSLNYCNLGVPVETHYHSEARPP